jgi:hypothetical protein
MSTISLFTVGTGTLSPKWPVTPPFSLQHREIMPVPREVGNFHSASLRRCASAEVHNLLSLNEIETMASYRSFPPVGPCLNQSVCVAAQEHHPSRAPNT